MYKRYRKIIDSIVVHWTIWILVGGPTLVASISVWIATNTAWLDEYGKIAWWLAGLLGLVLSTISLALIVWLRGKWIAGTAIRKWAEKVDSFNPLAREFKSLRINISDLVNPVTNRILQKRIIDCELNGPANILFWGKSEISNIGLTNCDIVLLRPECYVQNVVVFEDVTMFGCTISNATIFIGDDHLAMLKDIGANFVTRIGDPLFDDRPAPKPQ